VLDREVALKVLHAGALATPKAVERFAREAKAAAQLRHPHIVPIYDAGTDGPQPYIASAFIPGRTLADLIDEANERGDPMACRRAASIVHDLADALHYAHGLGIIHRDVKPANTMLDDKGQAHLMDFGLARFALSEEKLTRDGAILGTPAYMAPEQAQDGSTASAASDQYSLGATLYELLCGRTPFDGPPQILLFNAIHHPAPPLRSLRPAIPRDLETICLKSLAKTPSERYADCQELTDDLGRWLDGEPIQARPLGLVERFIRWCRRNPALATASGLAAVATGSDGHHRDCFRVVAVSSGLPREDTSARRGSGGWTGPRGTPQG
jgi:serine/threonine protein kinase